MDCLLHRSCLVRVYVHAHPLSTTDFQRVLTTWQPVPFRHAAQWIWCSSEDFVRCKRLKIWNDWSQWPEYWVNTQCVYKTNYTLNAVENKSPNVRRVIKQTMSFALYTTFTFLCDKDNQTATMRYVDGLTKVCCNVIPLPTHWIYCSLALNHRYIRSWMYICTTCVSAALCALTE